MFQVFKFKNLPQLLNYQILQDSSVPFLKKHLLGTLKNGKCQLLKMARSQFVVILSIKS